MKIGQKIKQRRLELGWTQQELADKMGYTSKSTIARIENGNNDVSQKNIAKFAEVLNTTIAYLMDWTEDCDFRVDDPILGELTILIENTSAEQRERLLKIVKAYLEK